MNINPRTNIAYGYVAANELNQDLVDILQHGKQAEDHSYNRYKLEMEDEYTNYVEECEELGIVPEDEEQFLA